MGKQIDLVDINLQDQALNIETNTNKLQENLKQNILYLDETQEKATKNKYDLINVKDNFDSLNDYF